MQGVALKQEGFLDLVSLIESTKRDRAGIKMKPPAFGDSDPEEWIPRNAVGMRLREKVQEVGQNKVQE